MEYPQATEIAPNVTTTTEEKMNSTRHEPITKYRIIISYGDGTGELLYCDDRDEAIVIAAKTGGRVESFVWGIGYQPILKVAPVDLQKPFG